MSKRKAQPIDPYTEELVKRLHEIFMSRGDTADRIIYTTGEKLRVG